MVAIILGLIEPVRESFVAGPTRSRLRQARMALRAAMAGRARLPRPTGKEDNPRSPVRRSGGPLRSEAG